MALRLCLAVALLARLGRPTSAEPEVQNLCPEGRVRFQGQVTFEDNQKPLQLSRDTVLQIAVAEEAPSASAAQAVYTHDVDLKNYAIDKELHYGFCADLSAVSARKVSLKARMEGRSQSEKLEFIGETVVTAGNEAYEADITLAKLDSAAAAEPSVADCQFGQMAEEMTGVAVKAAVRLNAQGPLPKPTYLHVSLNEESEDSDEPEVISLFSGDVSNLYEPGKPLPAFLCAKVPLNSSSVYTLDASVHLGWDGLETPDAEDRTPRKGDYVISRVTPVKFSPQERNYNVSLDVKPYQP